MQYTPLRVVMSNDAKSRRDIPGIRQVLKEGSVESVPDRDEVLIN